MLLAYVVCHTKLQLQRSINALNHREQMVVFRRDKILRRLLEELGFDVIFLNETMVTSHSRCVAVFTFITVNSKHLPPWNVHLFLSTLQGSDLSLDKKKRKKASHANHPKLRVFWLPAHDESMRW